MESHLLSRWPRRLLESLESPSTSGVTSVAFSSLTSGCGPAEPVPTGPKRAKECHEVSGARTFHVPSARPHRARPHLVAKQAHVFSGVTERRTVLAFGVQQAAHRLAGHGLTLNRACIPTDRGLLQRRA